MSGEKLTVENIKQFVPSRIGKLKKGAIFVAPGRSRGVSLDINSDKATKRGGAHLHDVSRPAILLFDLSVLQFYGGIKKTVPLAAAAASVSHGHHQKCPPIRSPDLFRCDKNEKSYGRPVPVGGTLRLNSKKHFDSPWRWRERHPRVRH